MPRSHSHLHTEADASVDSPAEVAQQRRALRLMATVLIPVALATLIGLILLWPRGSSDAQQAAERYFPPSTLYPTGVIVAIEPYECRVPGPPDQGGFSQTCARATVTVEDGPEATENVTIELPPEVYAGGVDVGVRVVLSRAPGNGDPDQLYTFNDFARGFPIAVFTLAFVIAVIAVARWRGLASILGLASAFFILLKFTLPGLLAGSSPVLIGLVGSAAIMLVVLYLAHGFRPVRRPLCSALCSGWAW